MYWNSLFIHTLMHHNYMPFYIGLQIYSVRAVRTLELWLDSALVSAMAPEVPLVLVGLTAFPARESSLTLCKKHQHGKY
jgi:hypothetical protein